MQENVRLLSDELEGLGYTPQRFATTMQHCRGEGIKFEYRIADGSRTGETVLLGLVIPDSVGAWPEGTPHWIPFLRPMASLRSR